MWFFNWRPVLNLLGHCKQLWSSGLRFPMLKMSNVDLYPLNYATLVKISARLLQES